MNARIVDEAVDLFCGAGGTSSGLLEAAEELDHPIQLTAVNHWPTAINSHSLNHPSVFHICETVENIWPPGLIKRRRLRLLCASCECTFHSIARGGGPCNEQSRSQPWQIIRWATDLDIEDILMENVKEWRHWGPLHPCTCGCEKRALRRNPALSSQDLARLKHRKGSRCYKPIKERKGEFFNAFINALKNLGYAVEWRLQNAADFGDATNRIRLMLMARKRRPIVWPEPTHGPGRPCPHRTARQIIDWSLPGQSIFNRKKPLSSNTLRRIEAGLRRFGGPNAEPFLVMMRGTHAGAINKTHRSVDEPLDTITAGARHHALVEPRLLNGRAALPRRPKRQADQQVCPTAFVIGQQSCAAPKSVQTPLPTVAQAGAIALVEPIIVQTDQTGSNGTCARDIDKPIPCVVTKQNLALVEPFLVKANHGTHKKRRGKLDRRSYPIDEPLKTVTAKNGYGVCEPFILPQFSEAAPKDIEKPLGTVTTDGGPALVEPFIVKYYGSGISVTVDRPLDTVTCKDRFLLVEPKTNRVLAELDIRFRMLQPHELAAAHSFPKHYHFTGTKEDQTAQIGNSVPVKLAKAHAKALLQ